MPVSVTQPQSHMHTDSVQTVVAVAAGHAGYGRGEKIQGDYHPENPQLSSHYEVLDPC